MNKKIVRKLLTIVYKPRVVNKRSFSLEGNNSIYKSTIIRNLKGSHNNRFLCNKSSFVNCNIYFGGSNNIIEIGDCCRFDFVSITCLGDNNHIKIGSDSMIMSGGLIHSSNGGKIFIGKNLLCSFNVTIRNNDGHFICDNSSNPPKIINEGPYTINIGDNVWVCQNSTLLKHTMILNDCVVGANALVDASFENSNLIIAGVPAKVLKANISWIR